MIQSYPFSKTSAKTNSNLRTCSNIHHFTIYEESEITYSDGQYGTKVLEYIINTSPSILGIEYWSKIDTSTFHKRAWYIVLVSILDLLNTRNIQVLLDATSFFIDDSSNLGKIT